MKKFIEIFNAVFFGIVLVCVVGLLSVGFCVIATTVNYFGVPALMSGIAVVAMGLIFGGIYYIKNR